MAPRPRRRKPPRFPPYAKRAKPCECGPQALVDDDDICARCGKTAPEVIGQRCPEKVRAA